jgi:hypothetical protein
VGAFQTNGIFTHLLEESSMFYNGFCGIYMLEFIVFDWGRPNFRVLLELKIDCQICPVHHILIFHVS